MSAISLRLSLGLSGRKMPPYVDFSVSGTHHHTLVLPRSFSLGCHAGCGDHLREAG